MEMALSLTIIIAATLLDMTLAFGVKSTSCIGNESCITLGECTQLKERILNGGRMNYGELNSLRNKQCGYQNLQVLVCCELNAASRSALSTLGGTAVSSTGSGGHGTELPSAPECGPVLSNRVVGGVETSIYEFPWMAMLEYIKAGNVKGFDCGGSLINRRYVLTAAHCVVVSYMRLISVRLGEWDVRTDPDCELNVRGQKDCTTLRHVNVAVAETIVHEGYERNSNTPRFDIALLRLVRDVDYTDLVRPICLPKPHLKDEYFIGSKMDVSGWGLNDYHVATEVKMKAELGIWNLEDCRKLYNNVSLIDSQMCAGGEAGIDTCNGDSGGPLMTIIDNSYTLAGIVSFGPSLCGTKGMPGVYTRVAAFLEWIKQELKP